MGIPFADFLSMTPGEFEAVYGEWKKRQDQLTHERWEQCRWVCFYTIRPYGKKGMRPEDVMSFAWDGESGGAPKRITKEEKREQQKTIKHLIELWKDDE